MKALLTSIVYGDVLRHESRGADRPPLPYLAIPERPLVYVEQATVSKAIRKGYLKRRDDGSYKVTKKGKRKLK